MSSCIWQALDDLLCLSQQGYNLFYKDKICSNFYGGKKEGEKRDILARLEGGHK